jgi:hypothetical protein
MQNIQKSKEMLAQIGAACVQITMGCGEAQERLDSEELLPALQELEYALGELYTNARKLRESAMSTTIDPALDHDGKTEPANEVPADPVCKCGHRKTEHMAEGPFLHALCVRCECDGFEQS